MKIVVAYLSQVGLPNQVGKVPKNILTGSLQFGGILHSVKIMDKNQKPKKITNSWRRILENDLQQGASRTIEPGLHRRISFKVSLGGHRRISLKYHRIGNYRDSCSSWKLLWWFPDQQLHQPKNKWYNMDKNWVNGVGAHKSTRSGEVKDSGVDVHVDSCSKHVSLGVGSPW